MSFEVRAVTVGGGREVLLAVGGGQETDTGVAGGGVAGTRISPDCRFFMDRGEELLRAPRGAGGGPGLAEESPEGPASRPTAVVELGSGDIILLYYVIL